MEKSAFNTLFYFMNENYTVLEVERTDLPMNSEKSLVFHWLIKNVNNSKVSKLTFKSMDSEIVSGNEINIRVFNEGELRFDKLFAKLSYQGDGHILMTKEVSSVPSDIERSIISYLNGL